MPAAPSVDELWPRRFAGLSAKRTHNIVWQAAAIAGEKIRRGALNLAKAEVSAPADAIAALIAGDAAIVRLIGPPIAPRAGAPLPSAFELPNKGKKPKADDGPTESVWPDEDAPCWLSVDRAGGVFPALVRIGFRGARVVAQAQPNKGPAMVRKAVRGKDAVYSDGVAKNKGWRVHQWSARHGIEASRLYSLEALEEAVALACQRLRKAGCIVRAPHVAQLHGGQSAVAEIWIRALSPSLKIAPTMAR